VEKKDEQKSLLHSDEKQEGEKSEELDRRGLVMSMVILILSIPALIGA